MVHPKTRKPRKEMSSHARLFAITGLGAASMFVACNSTPEGPAPQNASAPSATAQSTAAPPDTAPAPPATSAAPAAECSVDKDCGCGTDRRSGKCAYGPIAQIDESKQCPDFCGGLTGTLHIACQDGHCTQSSKKPTPASSAKPK